jgi:hypothetical protein
MVLKAAHLELNLIMIMENLDFYLIQVIIIWDGMLLFIYNKSTLIHFRILEYFPMIHLPGIAHFKGLILDGIYHKFN